jgi:hypothetical protein
MRAALGAPCAIDTCRRPLPVLNWAQWFIAELDPEVVSDAQKVVRIGKRGSWVIGCPEHAQRVGEILQQIPGIVINGD